MQPLLMLVAVLLQPPASSLLDHPLAGLKIPVAFKPCGIHAVLEMVGRVANVPVGFEAGTDCDVRSSADVTGGWLPDQRVAIDDGAVELTGMPLHAVLDAVVERAPDYAWKEVDGVIVVRPRSAWDNVWDPLTVPFRSPQQAKQLDEGVNGVLAKRLRPLVTTKGTLLERLNTAAVADGAGQWDVVKIREPEKWQGPGPVIGIVFRAGGSANGPGVGIWTSVPLMTSERDEQP